MKKDGAAPEAITKEVDELKRLKKELKVLEDAQLAKEGPQLDRKALDDTLVQRMFVIPSFEIYGGTGGFYDFGPSACAHAAGRRTAATGWSRSHRLHRIRSLKGGGGRPQPDYAPVEIVQRLEKYWFSFWSFSLDWHS